MLLVRLVFFGPTSAPTGVASAAGSSTTALSELTDSVFLASSTRAETDGAVDAGVWEGEVG